MRCSCTGGRIAFYCVPHNSIRKTLMKKTIFLIITILAIAGISAAQRPTKRTLHSAATTGPAVTLAAPSTEVITGNDFIVPVTVSDTTGLGIIAYQFDLQYDPAVIQPQSTAVTVTGTISQGMGAVFNPVSPGLIKVVVYGANPISGSGTLINFKFTAIGTPGGTSPLSWSNVMFNEGNPIASATNGSVQINPDPTAQTTVSFAGRETSSGLSLPESSLVRGNRFVLISDQQANAKTITISFDLAQTEPNKYEITDCYWTIVVFEDGVYVGTIFGDTTDGKAVDQANGGQVLNRTITAHLRVLGGMDRFEGLTPGLGSSMDFTSFTDYTERKVTTSVLTNMPH